MLGAFYLILGFGVTAELAVVVILASAFLRSAPTIGMVDSTETDWKCWEYAVETSERPEVETSSGAPDTAAPASAPDTRGVSGREPGTEGICVVRIPPVELTGSGSCGFAHVLWICFGERRCS